MSILGKSFKCTASILLLLSLPACTAGTSHPGQLANPASQDSHQQQQDFDDRAEEGGSSQAQAADANKFDFPASQAEDNYDAPGDFTPVSLPIRPSTLKKDKILAFAPDTNAVVNVVAFDGAFDETLLDGKHQFVVMTSDVAPAPTGARFFKSLLLPTAQAAVSAKMPSTSLCQQAGVTCCPIVEAGDTICPHLLTNSTPSQLYLAIMDQAGTLGKTTPEIIQDNILFTKATPLASSVSTQPAKLYTLTKNGAVKIQPVIPADSQQESKQQWQVAGSHLDNYLAFPASGSQLSFDSNHNLFGVMNKSTGISLHELDHSTEKVTDTGFVATQLGAVGYTAMKTVNEKIYYGIEANDHQHGFIFSVLDGSPYDQNAETKEDILFLKYGTDRGLQNELMTFKKVIVFDIDPAGYALVVYEDWEGWTRIRMGKVSPKEKPEHRFGGTVPLLGSFDFRELQIYHENLALSDYGQALLLDALNHKLRIIEFNYVLGVGAIKEIKMEKFVGLGPGKVPVGMALNDDKTTAYILNQGDETITVLSLNNDDGSVRKLPLTTGTIQLNKQIKDKTLTFNPNGIHYLDGQLFISSEGLRGELIVPLTEE